MNNAKKLLSLPNVAICLLLAVATLTVFWQTRSFRLVDFDDNRYIRYTRTIGGLTPQGIETALSSAVECTWQPMVWLSYMKDRALMGDTPAAYHTTNVAVHVVTTLLLFLFLAKVTRKLWRSGLVAALFALHPLHVESVAWIAERKDLLCGLFWVLGMFAYAWYSAKPGIARYTALFAAMLLGIMSKPMMVTFPFALLLLDYWPLNRYESGNRRQNALLILEKIPLMLLAVISSIVTFEVQTRAILHLPLTQRIANSAMTYIAYLQRTFWPNPLAVLYPPAQYTLLSWQAICSILFLLGVTLLAVRTRRALPALLVGWLWFLITFAPVIGLIGVNSSAGCDRHSYIPLIGLFLAVAWTIPDLMSRFRWTAKPLVVVALALVAVCAAVSYSQAQYWQDATTLFTHLQSTMGENTISHVEIGYALAENGGDEEATYHYSAAVAIDPTYPDTYYRMAELLVKQGNDAAAVIQLREAVKYDPLFDDAQSLLGDLLVKQRKYKEAADHYRQALKLGIEKQQIRRKLADALEQANRER